MSLSLIVAMAENRVIGRNGDLPWRLSSDLRRFKRLTMGHHLLMGRVTWDSLGRALPGRVSVVISHKNLDVPEGVHCVNSVDAAREVAADDKEPFVIGGAQIYELTMPYVNRIYLTEVLAEVAGDTYLPNWDFASWNEVEREEFPATDDDEYAHRFRVLERS